jgi:hypothetical protein
MSAWMLVFIVKLDVIGQLNFWAGGKPFHRFSELRFLFRNLQQVLHSQAAIWSTLRNSCNGIVIPAGMNEPKTV